MDFSALEPLADAVLYEGYQLYPYRPTALKNQQRWNFGTLFPEGFARAAGAKDPWRHQTECLAVATPEGGAPATAPRIEARLRFLQAAAGSPDLARSLTAGPWELTEGGQAQTAAWGESWGLRIVGRWAAEPCQGGWRIHAEVENQTPVAAGGGRAAALRKALHSAHWLLGIEGGAFLSSLDPPLEWRAAAAACRNEGLYPVLAGEAGAGPGGRWVLSAAIVLYDFPRLAKESPGDFFDNTEIDELLALRIATLTAEEREAIRADPRTRAMLERVEALDGASWNRLHGRTQVEASDGS